MPKLTWIDWILRTIPEGFIFIWGIYIVTKYPINRKKYVLSSIILGTLVFLVRKLPVYFGVHMIINIFLTISILNVTGLPIIKAIYGTLLTYLLLSIGEFLNILLLSLFGLSQYLYNSNTLVKIILGIPSLIIMILFILILRYHLKRKEGIKNVSC